MSEKSLIVFVDAYPYEQLSAENVTYLSSFEHAKPMVPGIGYSVNLYYELFAGLTPDEVGFFNKWNLNLDGATRSLWRDLAERLLDIPRRFPIPYRVLHMVYQRVFGTPNLANIPFSHLRYFDYHESKDIFSDDRVPTIFNKGSFNIVVSSSFRDHSKTSGAQDAVAVAHARALVDDEADLFVMLTGIDAIGHVYGVDSGNYRRHLQRLDTLIRSLVEDFRAANGSEAHVIILSDHGMAQIREPVQLDLEAEFGPVGPESYVYFLDSVFLRVWTFDPDLRDRIEEHLRALPHGKILTGPLREQYGITNPAFGTILYQLDEGYVFYPCFMAGRMDKAMHGYPPKEAAQKGIFLYEGPLAFPDDKELTTLQVHDFLCRVLNQTNVPKKPP